ncbi:5'-methylthioadenosine/S-adenosylhomocysteine nucleosidase family protein [Actinomadura macrotermitis]|uniref:5'-methylthioadenosine/S-adenosylhomocysteine nucleosidase n=1 Tax=Actinomadura macrotermitis TaxID=2585200 RepID=A0A7K0BTT8_9ACTN|nr:5'-methylthioadenosine/S-adenosylhomocysteine nucleosidase [Actinomadura macrotermitis]MQY04557.1 5'-methylthioadenosine/S-adenosylhomocysteine nucleosidase [Actinomadura macrotermitis]
MSGSPIVVLTALDVEYEAVREKLDDPRLHRHPQGTRFEVGRLAGSRCRIALGLVGKGNQSAAVLAERAIAEFTPAALLFVGVAGALHSHIALGDVVVATHVYAFHGGTSQDDGFKSRPRVWEVSHGADQIARHIARVRSWSQGLGAAQQAPEVHFGPIAAGEVVLNSKLSAHARWLQRNYNDALAIEMEGAGVAQAAHLNRALPVVVIRGVSDQADGTKEITDREQWQARAVANAAAFTRALAESLAAEEQDPDRHAATGTKRSSEMSGTIRNVAKDNARVGVQAGHVHGGIRMTGERRPPADPAEAVAGLAVLLQQARAADHLDEETYQAAQAELAAARETLRTTTPQDIGAVTLALKKVRGLVGDVAVLAAEVASVIALVQGLT